MQSIKELLGCSKCGCIVLPDATKCPNCGTVYDDDRKAHQDNSIGYSPNYSTQPKIKETGIGAIVAYYHFTCPNHGRVNVRASVIAPTLRCPFC